MLSVTNETYRYYVVYMWSGNGWRVGRCFISINDPLDGQDIIEDVQHKIEQDNGWQHNSVTLTNWKRL